MITLEELTTLEDLVFNAHQQALSRLFSAAEDGKGPTLMIASSCACGISTTTERTPACEALRKIKEILGDLIERPEVEYDTDESDDADEE